ncbi:MAG: glycosyltransferase, partial [Paludibacteraceae bacterium]|nr:glycosyltransferase [Paludibacteraceae bacterium]
ISNGIHDDFLHIDPARISDRLERRPNGDKNGIFNVMMIGRLSQEKRQDVILNAMKYSKYGDRIQLILAGKGPLYNRYLRQIRSLGLKHQPQFVFLNRQQLIDALLDTDLYIHASDMEIEAISCIEAFASGLVPVIADSSNSATPQFALDQRSLFKAGDPKDLARAIDYWLDNPQERHKMEKRYAEAANKYSLSNSVILFEQMLTAELNEEKNIPVATEHDSMLSALKRQIIRLYRHIA